VQSYLAKRLVGAIPLLLFISIISFAIIHLAPGGPAEIYLGTSANPESVAQINHALGLDQPVYIQYLKWLFAIIHGNFGISFNTGQPVIQDVLQALPVTLYLVGSAFILGWLIGIAIGVIEALKPFTSIDYLLTAVSFVLISIPGFYLALLLILFFTVYLGWLPSLGMVTQGVPFSFLDLARHMVMPVATLTAVEVGFRARFVRASMLQALGEDFIRTAQAKGLSGVIVVYKHALRNALLPLVTLFGLALPSLFGGAVLIENVFSLPGLGRLQVNSVFNRDYPTVMAINTIAAVLVVIGNLLADLMYGWVDPRIRYR
jgi:peptide/nickel transport system permease protein